MYAWDGSKPRYDKSVLSFFSDGSLELADRELSRMSEKKSASLEKLKISKEPCSSQSSIPSHKPGFFQRMVSRQSSPTLIEMDETDSGVEIDTPTSTPPSSAGLKGFTFDFNDDNPMEIPESGFITKAIYRRATDGHLNEDLKPGNRRKISAPVRGPLDSVDSSAADASVIAPLKRTSSFSDAMKWFVKPLPKDQGAGFGSRDLNMISPSSS